MAALPLSSLIVLGTLLGAPAEEHRQHLLSGDFNGDGYLDNAYASVYSEDQWRLIVHLDVLGDDGEIVVLEQHTPDVPISEIDLEVLPPGEYTTICGQVPDQCEAGKPHKITMESDGIYLIVLEASASLVYWDEESTSFVRHWLAD